MKKFVFMFLLFLLVAFFVGCSKEYPVDDSDKVVIYYFVGPGCPSCDVQSDFFIEFSSRLGEDVEVKRFDISVSEHKSLLDRLAAAYDERIVTAPVTFVGDEAIVGFNNAETTGLLIESIVRRCLSQQCMNPSDVLRDKGY